MKRDKYKTYGANFFFPKKNLQSYLTHYPKRQAKKPAIVSGIAYAAICFLWISLVVLAVKAI